MAETPSSPAPEPSTPGDAVPSAPAAAPVESVSPAPAAPLADDPTPPAPPAVEPPSPSLEPPAAAAPPVAAAENVVWAVAATEVVVEAEATDDAGEPRVATTLEVPPLTGGEAGLGSEGGEWDLLVGKVQAWLEQADLPGQWDRLSGPLRGLGLLLAVLLVLKLYGALLDTLDDLPLLPRLLQLVGLLALLRFSLTRLTRSSDRQEILADWKRRWDTFSGS
jgi:hypothetical protein